jgi:site-specific DNA recombinase
LIRVAEHKAAIRYAVYTRQSVDRLADFSSCESQFLTCQDYVRALNNPALQWCGQCFDDEGHSGATLDRPGMNALRQLVKRGQVDRIYAVALDRVTRGMRDAVMLIDEFERLGVDMHFVHQPELTFGAQGRFIRHVLAAFAQFEREMIAARFAETRDYLKKHGQRHAGKVPYGYDADPVTKQLVPNTAEARHVRSIFDQAAKGERPSQIAKAINARGWTTKVYHAKRSGKTTGGGAWTARQIIQTLRNPVYLGRFADGDTIREGCHDAIVDQDTFDAVQDHLDARRTTTSKRERAHRDNFTFRQKIVCPRCGRFLTTYQVTKQRFGARIAHSYYSCRSTAGGRPRCKGVQYKAWDIDEAVLDMLDVVDIWRNLLGPAVSDDDIRKAMQAWKALLWSWQRDWLSNAVERIEINEAASTLSVTFKADAGAAFLPENPGF